MNTYNAAILSFSIIIVLFAVVTYKSCTAINEIEENKVYTNGIVVSKHFGRKNNTVDYKFRVGGNEYKGNSPYDVGFVQPQVGDVFFVKYSSRDPSYSTMVVTQEDTKNNTKKFRVLHYYGGYWPEEERRKRAWR